MWQFKEFQPGDIIRNSHEEEFFTMQVPLQSVIREALQNSLDAAIPGEKPVIVRFLYSRASRDAGEIFAGLKEHLIASGIKATGIGNTGFDFLAVEDFNTKGLTGNTSYTECLRNGDGNFCNFWWIDGSTRKGIINGGRWGLGKYSFFVFSKVKLFFGISIPEPGNSALLMGRVLLKKHNLDGKTYRPEGIYASGDSEPIRESPFIDKFQSYFGLERGSKNGLSIIIPYPETDSTSSVLNDIVYHVLDNYLYSIAAGKLRVKVEERIDNQKSEVLIGNDTIEMVLRNFSRADRRFADFEKIYVLYRKILAKEPDLTLRLENGDFPSIDSQFFGKRADEVRRIYSESRDSVIKIRIPFRIKRGDTPEVEETHVDFSLSTDASFSKEHVQCLRNGIKIINGIRDFKMSSGLAVLIAEDGLASEFLGDSENPSHTEWNSRTERLRSGKFLSPDKVLKFIKDLPRDIVKLLSEKPESEDPDVLADIFFVNEQNTTRGGPRHRNPYPRPETSAKVFDLIRTGTGFRLSLAEAAQENFPKVIIVRTAYDRAEGNPFRKYSKFDYIIGSNEVKVEEVKGGKVLDVLENTIKALAESKDFVIEVTGFDPRRDLIVDSRIKEAENE